MVCNCGAAFYAHTKRAEVILSEEWGRRLLVDGVTVHSMHPGWVATAGVAASLPGFNPVVGALLRDPSAMLQDGTNTYADGIGLISTTDSSGNQTYRRMDRLGSSVALCDGSGTVVATDTYDAFGIVRSQAGSSSNYWLFTGKQRDTESWSDYLRARY